MAEPGFHAWAELGPRELVEDPVGRDQQLVPLRLGKRLQVLEPERAGEVERAGSGPPKRREVRPAAQCRPDVLGKCAHIRSLAACNPHAEGLPAEIQQVEREDLDPPGDPFDALAAPGQHVERRALALQRRVHRRDLGLHPEKALQDR